MGFTPRAEGKCRTTTAQRPGKGNGNRRPSALHHVHSGAGPPEGRLGHGEGPALQTLKQPRKHHDEAAAKKPAKEMTKAIRRANRDHRTGGISGK